jgi:hypothetical protein
MPGLGRKIKGRAFIIISRVDTCALFEQEHGDFPVVPERRLMERRDTVAQFGIYINAVVERFPDLLEIALRRRLNHVCRSFVRRKSGNRKRENSKHRGNGHNRRC